MRKVWVPMKQDNILKILAGTKTTTLRSAKEAGRIGLVLNESATCSFNGRIFQITCRGCLTIAEAGGAESIASSEDFGANGPKFASTRHWLEGSGQMFVYDLQPL